MDIHINSVCDIAVQAGDSILNIYAKTFDVEFKEDQSPLTEADRVSHRIISEELLRLYPDIPVLSEEGKDIPFVERKTWDRFWLVDPLDGTKEFIKRNGEFTVNIALIENNRPAAGVI
ncbi:MAG: 3'(2'),5'-bisphosphate nucleotidase CysQ, partial [Nitrospirae bacterium CG_4_9_14_3_um_filter_53_35]